MNKAIKIFSIVEDTAQFDKSFKGLQKTEDKKYISIYTDPFRTVPLYVSKNESGLFIFSDLLVYQQSYRKNDEIDEVGFWETLLFGTPLWTRTIYKDIKQIPGACKIIINKDTLEYRIERYWEYNISEDTSIKTIEDAAEGLNVHLTRIFGKMDTSKMYYMGLSGGLDSRLSLAYLTKGISNENLKLFTFGFDERILEYQYAQEIANAIGYENVMFHKLSPEIYKEALEYMPKGSCGQLGISHAHLLSFFKNVKLGKGLQISNYYSDALFGYATKLPKSMDNNFTSSYYYKRLQTYSFLKRDLEDVISDDISKISSGFETSSNYSSLDEYIYVTERHAKFHMHLAWLQSQFVETLTPYADLELFKYMISVPLKYREQKIILDQIFKLYFSNTGLDKTSQISSRFSLRFSSLEDWSQFKIINVANGALRKITNGRIQIFNKFQTEEHERLLFSHFRNDLRSATEFFMQSGLLDSNSKKFFDHLPFRAIDSDMRYNLISMHSLINS
jgi:asparagine synthetase B (glutamine-hydrolysing)